MDINNAKWFKSIILDETDVKLNSILEDSETLMLSFTDWEHVFGQTGKHIDIMETLQLSGFDIDKPFYLVNRLHRTKISKKVVDGLVFVYYPKDKSELEDVWGATDPYLIADLKCMMYGKSPTYLFMEVFKEAVGDTENQLS